jgi:hypothetical protein
MLVGSTKDSIAERVLAIHIVTSVIDRSWGARDAAVRVGTGVLGAPRDVPTANSCSAQSVVVITSRANVGGGWYREHNLVLLQPIVAVHKQLADGFHAAQYREAAHDTIVA